MPATCPHCGYVSPEDNPRFCSSCGARMDGTAPGWYASSFTDPSRGIPSPAGYREPKSALTAGFCSSFLPGLGQVYNGQTKKGFLVFILAIAGLMAFILPGLLVWLWAIADAYSTAGKMNAGTIPFIEGNTLHLIAFVLFALVVVVAVVILILWWAYTSLMSDLGTTSLTGLTGTRGSPTLPANAFDSLF